MTSHKSVMHNWNVTKSHDNMKTTGLLHM